MVNPIKDNRIVSDMTFALRLRNFIQDVQVSDAASDEEKEYLLKVAKDLLHFQVATLIDEKEKAYLLYNKVIVKKMTVDRFKELLKKSPVKLRHKKTGNIYYASRLVRNCTNANDGQELVMYSSINDRYMSKPYCREIKELLEKFEVV